MASAASPWGVTPVSPLPPQELGSAEELLPPRSEHCELEEAGTQARGRRIAPPPS